MKKLATLLLIVGIWMPIISFANPGEYLTKLSEMYKGIANRTWEYTNSLAKDKNARVVDKKRVALITEIKTAIANLDKLGPYEGDASLRDSVVSYLQLSYDLLNNDYSKIADLEAIAEESYDMMEAYLTLQDAAKQKMDASAERLTQTEKDFAKAHNINLIEGEETKVALRLRQANKMWSYYNELYLIFFKSFILEKNMLNALMTGDLTAVEQNRNSLLSASKEGLKKLEGVGAFDNDNTLKIAIKQMLLFYVKESETGMIQVLDFYLSKENFEKVNASFQTLGKKDRTQEAVNEYNEASTKYNEAVNVYNKTNESLNNERSSLLNNWNNTAAKFTSKNVK